MKSQKKKAEAIIKHLKNKTPKYRKAFEGLLMAGAAWDNKLEVFEYYGRFIHIKKNGQLDEL